MDEFGNNSADRLAVIAKGTLGALPCLGPILAEVTGYLIPNQRIDRISHAMQLLEEEIKGIKNGVNNLQECLQTPEGLDVFEEALVQTARSPSEDRQRRLAYFMANALVGDRLKYAEARKLLNILRELSDPEILWLLYYTQTPTFGSEYHKALIAANRSVLYPVSKEASAPQDEIDRGALQESYKDTLLRLGLLAKTGSTIYISPLGKLLMRYLSSTNRASRAEP